MQIVHYMGNGAPLFADSHSNGLVSALLIGILFYRFTKFKAVINNLLFKGGIYIKMIMDSPNTRNESNEIVQVSRDIVTQAIPISFHFYNVYRNNDKRRYNNN